MVKLFSKEGGASVSITGEDASVERFLTKYGYTLRDTITDEEIVAIREDAKGVVVRPVEAEAPIEEVVEEKPKKRATKKASKV